MVGPGWRCLRGASSSSQPSSTDADGEGLSDVLVGPAPPAPPQTFTQLASLLKEEINAAVNQAPIFWWGNSHYRDIVRQLIQSTHNAERFYHYYMQGTDFPVVRVVIQFLGRQDNMINWEAKVEYWINSERQLAWQVKFVARSLWLFWPWNFNKHGVISGTLGFQDRIPRMLNPVDVVLVDGHLWLAEAISDTSHTISRQTLRYMNLPDAIRIQHRNSRARMPNLLPLGSSSNDEPASDADESREIHAPGFQYGGFYSRSQSEEEPPCDTSSITDGNDTDGIS